jgi:hypothetical protein
MLPFLAQMCFATLGILCIYHGVRPASQYRSLWMRMKGRPAVQMNRTHRFALVSLGALLFTVSVLLAIGVVR